MSVFGALITRVPSSKIKFPYPKTAFCDVPLEVKTGVPMCRPLPRQFFPAITSESPGIAYAPFPSLQSLTSPYLQHPSHQQLIAAQGKGPVSDVL